MLRAVLQGISKHRLGPGLVQLVDLAFILWLMIGLPNFWFHGNAPPFFLVGVLYSLLEAVVLLKLGGFVRKAMTDSPLKGPFDSTPVSRFGLFFLMWACIGFLARYLIPAVPDYEAVWLGLMVTTMWLMAMRHVDAQSYFSFFGRVAFNLLPIALSILIGGLWNWSAHGPNSMVVGLLTEDRNGAQQARDYAIRIGMTAMWGALALTLVVWGIRKVQLTDRIRKGAGNE